jgi:large subunit ribosomal protein L4
MPTIEVVNTEGKKVKDLKLNDKVFGIGPNENVVHSVVLNYLANQRQGTQSTKTRAEVRGGGRKPWRQKGTGRARQGSIRAPQWIKGGIALGPKPRSYTYKINKKEKDLAVKSVLSAKLTDKELVVVDKLDLKDIKTKEMAKVLNNLKAENGALIVLDKGNKNVQMSVRNLEKTKASVVDTMNTYDILKHEKLILTEDAVKRIEEVYA